MNSLVNYLRKSYERNQLNPVGEIHIAGLRVSIQDPVNQEIDLKECLSYVFEKMPKIFYSNVRAIKIGQFPFLKEREVEAIYKDGVIYITNQHENRQSIISDIIHEVAHAFEEKNHDSIYEDEKIEQEFLAKRQILFNGLKSRDLIFPPIEEKDFLEVKYEKKFDNYLYNTIGYGKIRSVSENLFISPYAATCLREYFANAFENFFINDIYLVKKVCPNIYYKLMFYLEI